MTGLPLLYLPFIGQPAAYRKLGGWVCNPPAEQVEQAAEVCIGLAAGARPQEHGQILTRA